MKECYDGYAKGIEPFPYINKRYVCDWAVADEVANALMGLTFGVGGVGGTIVRNPPHTCPESSNLVAAAVGPIEGIGKPNADGKTPGWELAILTVRYAPPTYQLGGPIGGPLNTVDPNNQLNLDTENVYPFCSQDVDYDVESITMEAMWKYAGGSAVGKKITGTHTTINVNVATMTLTLHRVPYMPWLQLSGLMKRANDATFLSQPAGTVLFDKFRTSRVFNSDGTQSLEITEVFRWREPGWNNVPDPGDPASWVPYTNDGTVGGTKAYPLVDLRPALYGVSLS